MIAFALLPLLLASPGDAQPNSVPVSVDPIAEDEEEPQGWSGSVTAGLSLTSGNSDNKNGSITADAEWTGRGDKFTTGLLWNYQGEETGVTQRKVYGKAQYDHFYTEKFYSYGNASADHDFNADLDLRLTGGVGAGEEFVNNSAWLFSGELGLSYVDESFAEDPANPPGTVTSNEYLAARAAYNFEYKGSESWGIVHSGEVFPSLESGDDIYARWDTKAKTHLTDTMFAQLQWVFDYDNTPATGKGRTDHLVALTIGWTF